jgi:hypothetical protein
MGRKLEAPAIEGHELDGGMLNVGVLSEAGTPRGRSSPQLLSDYGIGSIRKTAWSAGSGKALKNSRARQPIRSR